MRKFDNINVIPFIDILLVLLAIVLTTATFIANGQLDISLPRASTQSEVIDATQIEIAIDRSEALFVDGERATFDEIRMRLEALSEDTRVLLAIDETVEFKRFVSMIDLLKALSLQKVSIVTRKE